MTLTPWGDATQLRSRRLRPGPGADPVAVTRNQRERMYAATVAAVAENGYEATRVADIVKLSGVSRSAFYKHFDDKLDCFLATLDELAELACAQIGKALRPDAAVGAAAAHRRRRLPRPAARAARRGAPLPGRGLCGGCRRRSSASIARSRPSRTRSAAAFSESPERKGMPRDIVRAIVGGIRKTIHTRVRRGEQAELIEQLPQLIDWGLSYDRRPRRCERPRRKPDRGAAPRPTTTSRASGSSPRSPRRSPTVATRMRRSSRSPSAPRHR